MARFRHLHANSSDWIQTHGGDGLDVFKSPLENGHALHVWKFSNDWNKERGWSWSITDPSLPPPTDPDHWWNQSPARSHTPAGQRDLEHHPYSHTWLAAGGDTAYSHNLYTEDAPGEIVHKRPIATREEAQREAEEHYQKMFPIGTSTGFHDSGVDYDDIMKNYRDYL